MQVIVILGLFLFLFGAPLLVVGILGICVVSKKSESKKLQAKENNKPNGGPIGPANESDINKDLNLTNAFCEMQLNNWLRKKYRNLRQWRSLGRPVGSQFNGKHYIELTFWDGSVQTLWIDANFDLQIKVYDADPEKIITPEVQAEEWIQKWKSFLHEKYNRREGFLIEKKDLPSSKEIVDLILDRLTGSGDFSAVCTDEGIRCVVES